MPVPYFKNRPIPQVGNGTVFVIRDRLFPVMKLPEDAAQGSIGLVCRDGSQH